MYDLIVIGAGSAGMGSAIYSARFGLKTLIIGEMVGGLINDSPNVENYPGFKSISGFDLMMRFKEHVDSLGVEIKAERVTKISKNDDSFIVETNSSTYNARGLVLATGSKHRKLGLPREDELTGKGVSYCATCDGAFFKDQIVAVVGGSDAACVAASVLSEHASKVFVLVRRDKMRAEPINVKRLESNEKVEILYERQVVEIIGKDALEGVKLNSGDILEVSGLFIEVGHIPSSELALQLGVAVNDHKEIIIDENSRTNVPRVYAAGDVVNRRFKQVITGVAEGVIAAFSAYDDLS